MSDLAQLAHDFRHTANVLRPEIRKLVSKGSLNIKTQARELIRAQTHHEPTYLPHYPRSISYDIEDDPNGSIVGVIGPDWYMLQGPLGGLLEYGSVNNRPYPHLNPALQAEIPRTEQALGDLLERLFQGRQP